MLSLNATTEPTTYVEAQQHECRRKAMNLELTALEENGTWSLVPAPSGIIPIGNKWVYRIKRKVDGSVERYKTMLVAKGYNQVERLDYFDTFSPVAKLTTVRMVSTCLCS